MGRLNCFDRCVETSRTKAGILPAGFVTTDNSRCTDTLRQAQAFAKQIHKSEVAIEKLKAAVEARLQVIKEVAQSPLPEVMGVEKTGGDLATPVEKVGGADWNMMKVTEASVEFSHRIQTEVLVPVRRWQDKMRLVESRYRELEGARTDLDHWRRQVEGLSTNVQVERARLQASMSIRSQNKIEKNTRMLQDKQGRLQTAEGTYRELEAALYSDLQALVSDAQWLRNYDQLSLKLESEALTAAADAFGELPDPPVLPPTPGAAGFATSPRALTKADQDFKSFKDAEDEFQDASAYSFKQR